MTRINRIKNRFAGGNGSHFSETQPMTDGCSVPELAPHPGIQERIAIPSAVFAIPVQSDGRPAQQQPIAGTLLAIGPQGITFSLETPGNPLPTEMMVGIPVESGRPQYAGIEVWSSESQADGRTIFHALFGGSAAEILQPRNLTPRFHFDSMTFTLGLPTALIHSWAAVGVLQPVVIDRLWLCPICHGLPTFRSGCGQCGSGRVIKDRSDCMAVDEPALATCPNVTASVCSASKSLPDSASGALEVPSYHCQDCHWTGRELAPVNQCLHCEHRFAAQQAYELVLQGYYAHRLDPMDFCPSE
jgi:hypothetical protein